VGQSEFLTYCVTNQKIQTDPLCSIAFWSTNKAKPRKYPIESILWVYPITRFMALRADQEKTLTFDGNAKLEV